MERYEFEVNPADAGKRLDIYLVDKFSHRRSRSFIQQIISEGLILLNGKPAKAHHKVEGGNLISISIIERPGPENILPENIPLNIIFEDAHLLVINKPAGMVVHPATGNYSGTLVNALLCGGRGLSTVGGPLRPGIVHRLDKDTSGLIVVAKKNEAHYNLARQFQDHTIKRKYVALVKGEVELDAGLIDLPIARHPRNREKMAINYADSKNAQTIYRVLKRFRDYTFIELMPKTGRTHQLRVHLAYIGHPILGDIKYGVRSDKINRPALHAQVLGFSHPATGKYIEFSTDLPADMERLIETE